MRFPMTIAVAATMIAVAVTEGLDTAEAAVLCQKKSGAIVVRDPACKKKETPFDVSPFVAAVPAVTELTSRVTGVDLELDALKAMGPLVAGAAGTVGAYAIVQADGLVREGFSQHGSVTGVREGLGFYDVSFGFTLRPNQPVLVTTRESGVHTPICTVAELYQTTAYLVCKEDAAYADTAFTIVVLN